MLFGELVNRSKVCKRIVKSLSNSRKMLRFMKFINAIQRFTRYSREVLHQKIKKINIIEFINVPPEGAQKEQEMDRQQAQSFRINYQGIFKLIRLLFRLLGDITAIFFYISEDILLLAQIKLIRAHVIAGHVKWLHLRNYFALWKNLFHILNSLLLMYSLNCRETHLGQLLSRSSFQKRVIRDINEQSGSTQHVQLASPMLPIHDFQFEGIEQRMEKRKAELPGGGLKARAEEDEALVADEVMDEKVYQTVHHYFEVRSLMKLEILNAWQSGLRAIMLLNLLKVPGFTMVDEVVVTLLGITTNCISLAKQVQQIK